MTNSEKLEELFPNIPDYSGIDYWGDFWEEEYKEQNAQQDNWIFVGNNPSFSPFDGSGEYILVCPKCGYKTSKNTPYCPMCGNKNDVK